MAFKRFNHYILRTLKYVYLEFVMFSFFSYPCVEVPSCTWNFQITIRSIGTNFRMDSKWFQMQGLDLILETPK